MPYTYTLSATIPASPEEIYDAWLDSIGHAEMTGGEATMSDEVGAEVSAFDGYISGRNLELVPGERIVQSWRTDEFGDEDEDSLITVVLQDVEEGTLLTLEHSNVPDEFKSYEEGGWQSNYFEPMIAYFTARKEAGANDDVEEEKKEVEDEAPAREASFLSVGDEEPPPARTARRPRQSAGGAGRPARARKAKRKAVPAKAPPKKSKGRRAAKARSTAAHKRSKSTGRKSVKGKVAARESAPRKSASRKPPARKSTSRKPARGRRR